MSYGDTGSDVKALQEALIALGHSCGKAYLEGGAHALVLYASDSTPSSGYSGNYLYLDGLKIVVTYEEGLVYYCVDGAFRKCQVFYPVNGVWVQCIPYYGSGGVWNQCGG